MFDPCVNDTIDTMIIERTDLSAGAAVQGPALIVESQTTTVLGSDHRAVMQGDGSLRISRRDDQGANQ